VVEQLRGLDLPVIAAVNGPCAGAGLAWACGCDIRVAGRSATFHTAFAKAGLTGDHGISWTLPRVVGAGRAMAMLLLDEPVDAEQALAWGLVTEVVDDDALLARARAIAGQLAGRSRLGLAGLKANLLDSQTAALGPSLDTEADRLIAAMRAPESAALARRFLGRDA
jgi:2-(1,2-epoxy-1,2-dihydrophenyl)acetyl-CoA isomerase